MHEIDGNTQVLGIIGNPVRHTMSPAIHHFLAERLGDNLAYLPFEVQNDIHVAVKGAYALGIAGMNVTVPYKSAVMEALTDIDDEAAKIGAVNTLVRTEHGFKGYNTDVTGLRRELREAGISVAGERAVILGAGGAARAAAMMCASDGACELYLINRNREKAKVLAEAVQKGIGGETAAGPVIQVLGLEEFEKLQGNGYIAFQCTSVGLFPNTDEAVTESREFYRQLKYAVDLIYTPRQTKFMKLAEKEGAKAVNGSMMLIGQAIASYELWTGHTVSDKVVKELLEELTEKGLIG